MRDLIKLSLVHLIEQHKKLPEYQIALAVWFNRTSQNGEVFLLEASPQFTFLEMTHAQADSFGLGHIKTLRHWMVSPKVLEEILDPANQKYQQLRHWLEDFEPLHINPSELGPRAIERFGMGLILPENALEGWYLNPAEYAQFQANKFHPTLTARPQLAVLTVEESPDFIHRKGVMFSPDLITGAWMPNTPDGVTSRTWYDEAVRGSPGYFVFRGGRAYNILGFEIVPKPSLARILTKPNPDNRYVQVLLKAV